jgi:hypothetical protein
MDGDARIGWVTFAENGKSVKFGGKNYMPLKGDEGDANYTEQKSGDLYLICECDRDGRDAVAAMPVVLDEDAAEEYWLNIRKQRHNTKKLQFTAKVKR